ncbi:response regulator [Polaribacter ponticola]|uniref:histidine kinase n=1 Tax=Polaribacter ponticola TaxID=2978475 RepID=A0ABT5SFL5_9FLAO|nr:response regulator [Polaribacter sp. MSW5]MDD7916037.1 response regulator [Polaribacter sp. MSW5]
MIFITSMVCFFVTLISFIIAYIIGKSVINSYIFGSAIIFLITAILSKKGFPKLARFIFLILFNLIIAFMASYLGKEASVEFFFMFSIGLPFAFFSFSREKIKIIIFCLVPVILWFILFLNGFKSFIDYELQKPTQTRNIVYHSSITITLLLVVFQLIYYSYVNAKVNITAHNTKQEAIEASDAKSQFLSTMSHEIRTPLNAVIGLSHILGDNEPRKDQVQNIEALNYSGKILLNLLNNVLDYSKMQSTTIDLDEIPTDLSKAIKQIKKVHEASCLRKGIEMNLEIDEDIPFVWLDIVRFNQVINNLVTNAIKFTEKGSVTLRIKKTGQNENTINLLTEIIDTGIGIPEDKHESIWEAYTQASTTTNRLYGGTGLGLPIVKSIVKSMGSDVKINSVIDKGSSFYFSINLKIASERELNKTTEKRIHHFDGKKILLVEDNQINIMVGKQILEKAKLEVEIAKDGLTAVQMAKENHYDTILMDIQMPVMDGYTASKKIREFNKKVPIIALSASVFMELKDRMIESGMNGFIFKPFDPEDLLNEIEDAINAVK